MLNKIIRVEIDGDTPNSKRLVEGKVIYANQYFVTVQGKFYRTAVNRADFKRVKVIG